MVNESRLCPRCALARKTVLVNRKDPKKNGKLWRIEVCPTCGFNFDLEEVPEKEAKLIEAPKTTVTDPYRWKPYF